MRLNFGVQEWRHVWRNTRWCVFFLAAHFLNSFKYFSCIKPYWRLVYTFRFFFFLRVFDFSFVFINLRINFVSHYRLSLFVFQSVFSFFWLSIYFSVFFFPYFRLLRSKGQRVDEDYTTEETPCPGICTFEHSYYIGDGYCDDGANNLDCNFDGGDCCGPNVITYYCTGI